MSASASCSKISAVAAPAMRSRSRTYACVSAVSRRGSSTVPAVCGGLSSARHSSSSSRCGSPDEQQQRRRLQRQEAQQLPQRGGGHVVRIVHDDEHLATAAVLLGDAPRHQVDRIRGDAVARQQRELLVQGLEQLRGRQVRLPDAGDDPLVARRVGERMQHRRFAGARFPGQRHQPVAAVDQRAQLQHGLAVPAAQVQELRVRAQPEWQPVEFEPLQVHGVGLWRDDNRSRRSGHGRRRSCAIARWPSVNATATVAMAAASSASGRASTASGSRHSGN